MYPPLLAVARLVTVRPSLEYWLLLTGVALATWAALVGVERRPWRDLGLGREALRPRALALGTAVGALAIAAPSALLLAVGQLRVVDRPDGSSLGAGLALLASLAPAALWEELLFRGYPFQVLREGMGAPAALALTSAVFGAIHLQNPNASIASAAVVALAGIFLGAVLLATGSLWAAFLAHLAWNWTLAGGLHAAVSGLPMTAPDFAVVDAGADWLTGGAWGPEGGAGAVAGMLGALTFLWWRARRAAVTDPLDARPVGRGSF